MEADVPTFAGSRSMRENYETQGVDAYYASTGAAYRNPHFAGIMAAAWPALSTWVRSVLLPAHGEELGGDGAQILVGAAAQVTATPQPALPASALQQPPEAQEQQEDEQQPQGGGLDAAAHGRPQEAADGQPQSPARAPDAGAPASCTIPPPCYASPRGGGSCDGSCLRVLDLACGSGEASQAVGAWWQAVASCAVGDEGATGSGAAEAQQGGAEQEGGAWRLQRPAGGGLLLRLCVDAADPYTSEALRAWTGRSAETFSFQDVAGGWLLDQGRSYHLCVCSYAMHVLSGTSYLSTTLQQLALACEALLILSPHKLPHVEERTGWELVEHVVRERVHARLFRSTTLLAADELSLRLSLPGTAGS